ncbi:patatin-like phospholipase family protein [Cellulomonas sp. KRMCY2]|uniref:patatin-like phospholipase family protein n=1 Tax=Cellulomonas sp. KRMCY2 TaxID=1304865 RepID=UPI00045E7599|nr:patatin-like phospholipase family protein [Cellulomonas sp. KRMCY2]
MTRPTRVALALGSGGARGYAHIGVIEVLEERGYEIVCLAGSSMGALVGGLHAAGRLGAFADWSRTLTQRDVLRLLDPSLKAPGAFRGEKILARVSELLGGALIEDLRIPFTAVATDLHASKEVWFQQGPVETAIRASIALPGVMTPVMVDGHLLADGGLMNPVPVAAITAARADITVAVSLGGDRTGGPGRRPAHESVVLRPAEELLDRLRRTVDQVREIDLPRFTASHRIPGHSASPEASLQLETVDVAEALPPGLRTIDVVNLSIEAMQNLLTRYRLASNPPDVLITAPVDACGTLDFHLAADMIRLGRDLAVDALDLAELPEDAPTHRD